MTEPWRFVVFEGDTRTALGDELARIYRSTTSADQIQDAKAEKLRRNPSLSPCILAIGMHRQVSKKIPEIEEIEAVACAVQNLHLMATALESAATGLPEPRFVPTNFVTSSECRPTTKSLACFTSVIPQNPGPQAPAHPIQRK